MYWFDKYGVICVFAMIGIIILIWLAIKYTQPKTVPLSPEATFKAHVEDVPCSIKDIQEQLNKNDAVIQTMPTDAEIRAELEAEAPPITKEVKFGPRFSKGETICRHVLEEYYGVPFKSARPNWLKNINTGANCELDCYNETLGIAVEYNGIQHYMYPNPFHKSEAEFRKQIMRDKFKVQQCAEHGIKLATVPYTVPLTYDAIREYLLSELPAYEDIATCRMEE